MGHHQVPAPNDQRDSPILAGAVGIDVWRIIEVRRKIWKLLRDGLAWLEDTFILPDTTVNSDPIWVVFLLTMGMTRNPGNNLWLLSNQ
jgi:hypothetical protein